MDYTIEGSDMQSINVNLESGDSIYGSSGHIIFKTPEVKINTTATGVGGGIFGMVKRGLTGGSLFVMTMEGPGNVSFTGFFPGKIKDITLDGSTDILVEHNSFIFAENSVVYDAAVPSVKFMVFGGEGIFLAKFRGSGKLFVHGVGGCIEKDLDSGETIQVEMSHLLAMESKVTYNVVAAGGIKTMVLSGEGLAMISLTGPGKVWIHTSSLLKVAQSIMKYIPARN